MVKVPFSWNFPGAYVVQFMTGVSCSACLYTCYHFIRDSSDFCWKKEMRMDELSESAAVRERAAHVKERSFFRWLAETRDRAEPGKDTRIFRI